MDRDVNGCRGILIKGVKEKEIKETKDSQTKKKDIKIIIFWNYFFVCGY